MLHSLQNQSTPGHDKRRKKKCLNLNNMKLQNYIQNNITIIFRASMPLECQAFFILLSKIECLIKSRLYHENVTSIQYTDYWQKQIFSFPS